MGLLRNIRTFESLGLKDYRYLWLGQMSTSMGQWMDQVSRTWLIYDLTHSPLHLGLVSAARGIPLLLFGVIAGVAADRWGRKLQLIVAQTMNVFINLILATLIMTGRVEIWHIYVTGILAGTVQAFQQPARQVLISDLVGEKHLLNAISLNSAAINTSRSIGPAISGLVIAAFDVHTSYFVQAALFIMATIWTIQIKIPKAAVQAMRAKREEAEPFFKSMNEGLTYIVHQPVILAVLILGLAPSVLGMPFISLMPVFAVDVFHGGSATQGFLLSMVGGGAVLGALTMASLGSYQGRARIMIFGALGFGLSLVFFSQSPVLILAAVFALIAGFCNSSYTSQNQTILQIITPHELRGRVLGMYLLNRGLQPLGSFLAGVLASWAGGPWAVTIMGSSCLLLAAGIGIFMPKLRNLNVVVE